jgi:hypothetical protein
LEELERIELTLTGFNSPAQDQERMILTYIDTSNRTEAPEDGTHPRPATTTDAAAPTATLCAEDTIHNDEATENDIAISSSMGQAEESRPETLIETFCDMFDFQNMADWDLDCLALYPPQIAYHQ